MLGTTAPGVLACDSTCRATVMVRNRVADSGGVGDEGAECVGIAGDALEGRDGRGLVELAVVDRRRDDEGA